MRVGRSLERFKRFLHFTSSSLIVGCGCHDESSAVNVTRLIDDPGLGEQSSEVIIGGNIFAIPGDNFLEV